MTDHFATLELPRRPWLDMETVQAAFHRLAATAHPDAGGDTTRFAAINTAHTALREPATRLKHLLELAAHTPPPLPVPDDLAELFMSVAAARQRLATATASHAAADSALARAMVAGELRAARTAVTALLEQLAAAQLAVEETLRALDAAWPDLEKAAALAQRFAFLAKWNAQLSEALLAAELGAG